VKNDLWGVNKMISFLIFVAGMFLGILTHKFYINMVLINSAEKKEAFYINDSFYYVIPEVYYIRYRMELMGRKDGY